MTTLILFNLLGVVLIAAIAWWFWFSKMQSSVSSKNKIEIKVKNGVYEPANITVTAGKPIHLIFLREDPTPCSEWVIFPQLEKSYHLPLQQRFHVELNTLDAGTYDFSCQMNMYRGKLIVSSST